MLKPIAEKYYALIVVLMLCAIAGVAASNSPYNHDEESYLGAAIHLQNKRLYSDFVYLQTPLYPLIARQVINLNGNSYFRSGRLLTFLMTVVSIVAMTYLGWTYSNSLITAVSGGVMFSFSTVMIPAMGLARNDMMAVAFALLALVSFQAWAVTTRLKGAFILLSGVFAVLALSVKISFLFVAPVLLCYLILLRILRPSSVRVSEIIVFAIGMSIGSLPLAYFAIAAKQNFFYGVWEHFSYAPQAWFEHLGISYELSFKAKLIGFVQYIFRDVGLACMIFSSALLLMLISRHQRRFGLLIEKALPKHILLPAFLCLSSIPFTIAPVAVHVQYFQLLIPFLILASIGVYQVARQSAIPGAKVLFASALALSIVPGAVLHIETLLRGSEISRVEQQAFLIRQALGGDVADKRIATLSPIRVADAGFATYSELAAGPFFFRTANKLPAAKVHALGGLSPQLLADVFSSRPPAAIFVGIERLDDPNLDGALVDFADANRYRVVSDYSGIGRLYVAGSATE